MGVFLFDVTAILLFWKLADKSRMREMFPVMTTSVFVRFLEHFIVIDWMHIWKVFGTPMMSLWIPLSANVTVWPVAGYLFIQYLPEKRRWLYGLCWVATMLMYLQLLIWFHVFTMGPHWHMFKSFGAVSVHFTLMYWVWYWQTQQLAKKRKPKLA
ncbi:MAG: hypothetical protein ACXVDE_00965 [Tumebacillaceae bacterium]